MCRNVYYCADKYTPCRITMVIIDYDKSSPLDIASTNFYKLTNDSTSRIESDVINQFKPKGCHNRKVFLLVAIFAAALFLSVLMMLGSQTNALAQSQNQSNASGQKGQFFADLTGQGVTPPRTTNATGKATFAVTDGANKMSYSVKADIDKVTDVFLSASSGGRYNDLVVLRSSVKDGVTGPIKGTLVEGNFLTF